MAFKHANTINMITEPVKSIGCGVVERRVYSLEGRGNIASGVEFLYTADTPCQAGFQDVADPKVVAGCEQGIQVLPD